MHKNDSKNKIIKMVNKYIGIRKDNNVEAR